MTIDAVRAVTTTDWFSKQPSTMPVSIAELGIPPVPATPGSLGGCRSDLLTVDGKAVPLRVRGTTVTTCDGAPVHLAAGSHDVRTAPGSRTGIDLDQLALSTVPSQPVPTADPHAKVTVTRHGRVSFDLTVKSSKPTWLVLGQSWTRGWQATANGKDLGRSVLVDGYANGWLVDPGPAGTITVHLRWTPQKIVWAGLGASLLGTLLCLGIVLASLVLGARRRTVEVSVHPEAMAVLRARPVVAGAAVGWTRALGAALGLGVVAGVLVHPLVGLVTAPVALVGLRWRYGRAVGLLAPGLLAAAAGYTALREVRRHLKADFGWTDYFRPAHTLAWCALVAVAVLLVVDALRHRGDD